MQPPTLMRPSIVSSIISAVLFAFSASLSLVSALEWSGAPLGQPQARATDDELRLENGVIASRWSVGNGVLRPGRVTDVVAGKSVDLQNTELFQLTLVDGQVVRSSELRLIGRPTVASVEAEKAASILARRFAGQQLSARLQSSDGNLEVIWRAVLRDGANAIDQEFVFQARTNAIAVKETRLVELPPAEAKIVGLVPGSPLVIGNLFFAYEHPDSQTAIAARATAVLVFNLVLQPGQPVSQSSVMGVAPPGQLRRGFLYYLERERAHPFRPFLHYNSWYDICWGNRKITEAECLDVVNAFGRELIRGRGVPLASFVWDDGWDDPTTLWRPVQTNFPHGFTRVLAAARSYDSTLGFWLSPFGGYGQPKQDRVAMGREQGFELGPEGFSLAGPKYYGRFLETCSGLIRESGANFFKFDGLARNVNETEAMLRLTRALRAQKPDLFISITTGTWPSPFWLWYGDSTWRGGGDMGFTGAGSKREQWITYRDMETYRNVVRAAPLYPINSLMTQGFAHARYGTASEVGDNAEEIRRELRSFFASGTCLQELYVTPSKMTAGNWDDLAQCAKWSHANAELLVDTHWIGGDPGKAEPYGWASWSPRKSIVALRNPSSSPGSIALDIAQALEAPPSSTQAYTLRSPWPEDAAKPAVTVRAGQAHSFELAPFEVAVFDVFPMN